MLRKLMATAAVATLLIAGCSAGDETTPAEPASTEDPSTTAAPDTTDAPDTTASAPGTDAPSVSEPPTTATPTTAADADDAANGDVQYESLSTRPWASPGDAHQSPQAAVERFLEFATSDAAGALFARDDVAIGGYSEGDARSGEMNVQFRQQFTDTTRNTSVLPGITVLVRRAGPQDTWWVAAAVTDGLTVAAPAADTEIGARFDSDLTNDMIVDRVEQRLFTAGDDEPFFEARLAGGGIFTTGRHAATLDTTSCGFVDGTEADAIAFEVDVCDGPGTAGAEGTLVVVSNGGITTVPVVHAG